MADPAPISFTGRDPGPGLEKGLGKGPGEAAGGPRGAPGRPHPECRPRGPPTAPVACHGECPKNRCTSTAEGEPGLNDLRAGHLAFFGHIDGPMQLMAELLRRGGGHADEIMGIFARPQRSDPCPCGSGRKAKQCQQAPGGSLSPKRTACRAWSCGS